MKLTHLYAVCACALLSLGAVNADNAYAQKAPAKKEAAAAHKNAPVPVDRIAAVVNHDVITEIQLQQRIHQVATNLRRRNIPLPPMDNLRDQTLDRMILERIIEQKARDTGIRIDDNMLNGAIEQIATNNGLTVPQLEKNWQPTVFPFRASRARSAASCLLSVFVKETWTTRSRFPKAKSINI